VWKAITEYLQRTVIGEPECILEIGPGYGDFINQVKAGRRIAIDSLDVSEHLDPGIEFFQGSGADLKFLGATEVDTVFASNVLEHFPKDIVPQALHEYSRVLKPTGLLVLIQPNFRLCYDRYFDDFTHQTIFTDESLCGTLQAHGFEIAHRRNRFLPFSMHSRLPKSYVLTKLYLNLRIPLMAGQMLIVGRRR
jgi:ubiquinone/menaquinone biosynthesis C-methylase UbiE